MHVAKDYKKGTIKQQAKDHMKKIFLLSCSILTLMAAYSQQATSQVKEEFDDLIFYIPVGFIATKTENNMQLTDATVGNSKDFSITINKSTVSLKKIEKSFPVFWRESLLNDGIDNPVKEPEFVKAQTKSGWSCFRGGKMVQYNSQSTPFYYHLIILRYMGVTLKIITRANTEELFMQKYPQLIELTSSVNFKTTPSQANQNNQKPN